MKTALISVYNKEGIVEFAKELADLGFKILASGGTAKALLEAGLEVQDVSLLVGGGPILGHRVVTLSREVHAGLLAKDDEADRKELSDLKIPFIDLVCGDLYPLEEEIAKPEATLESVIEKTDIGGPAMLRSAAKGRRIVVCDPQDRQRVVDWLKGGEKDRAQFIAELAAKAEGYVANYVFASARYLSAGKIDGVIGKEILEAKYGENGWQTPAGLYCNLSPALPSRGEGARQDPLSISKFQLIAGTAPSYNNLADVDRLLQTITHIAAGFDLNKINLSPALPSGGEGGSAGKPMIAVGVKHGNPCGAAVSDSPSSAIRKMLEGDLRAIFGGVVMVNFEVDEKLAEVLLTHKMENNQRRLLDGVIAPSFTPSAIELMKRKGDKCRFLVNPALATLSKDSLDNHPRFRYVRGGFLKQPNYNFILDLSKCDVVAPFMGPSEEPDKSGNYRPGQLSEQQKSDLILAWAIGSTSNSNTVTIAKNNMLIGNGVGQQDRVSCCQLAIKRATDAKHDTKGAAAYSDSFFPFVDGVEVLSAAGIKTIFATSGSVRDGEVKQFCVDNSISLAMLPDSQARGFFGH